MHGMGETVTAERYRAFGEMEARGHSPSYERLCVGVAADAELLAVIDTLPPAKRQPNLLLGAVRFLGGPAQDYGEFRAWTLEHWARVSSEMLARRTQTNEPGRCATLLPLLARLPQPLALIEVGASAGLCLYPDRYRYRYDDGPVLGALGPVTLTCRTSGPVPIPERLPSVVWRAGIDLHPLDVTDADHLRWLEALVWPEQHDRLVRLRAAARIARAEPPRLVQGDLNATVADLAGQAPPDATLVVFHSAVLPYVPQPERDRFAETMRALPARWISNEAPIVLPDVAARLTRAPSADGSAFVLALDEEPVAYTGPHGQFLDWLS
ncbi:hypothetical protein SAMN05421874_102334 [Nonomuraea maritima]|uniref:DUF2332 domain-containing protein n=2 Tax=Nonomuraea maritima TaxID=683260 RepID=A0A1G8UZK8_9ACTN|nr:hypothetical protein SAMN05421874_102334 [Nonomuraea maritima]